ncbi:CDP-alcohol phosphatidyltransferase [Arthrobacter saudimassiliensis]|uniref:CDP-alcohol phosphatidyltransferase n=1 Tax=Arthrobacter saudimassiliensis TaxID=1461584 RepID=A0A078MMJ5_9MICC|nr:CDP-alcohol phosphatidyltransferase [Arthrobacter saudimassiliensis]
MRAASSRIMSAGDNPGFPPRYRDALRLLASAQKPGYGVPAYTRWINRRAARVAAAAAVRWHITPNSVTFMSAATSAVGILLLFLPHQRTTGPAVALLLAVGYLLDSADGQVARVLGTGSAAGEWLDHVVDAVRIPAIHLGVLGALLLLHAKASPILLLPAMYCLLSTAHFMSQILAEQLVRNAGLRPTPVERHSAARSVLMLPTDAGTLCWIFVLWGTPLFIPSYFALFLANLVAVAASMGRKWRHLASLRKDPAHGGTY